MSNTFRFDTHVHTDETSHCGKVPGEEMVRLYAEAGYSGFVMTDHYNRYSMQVHGCQTPEEEVETFLRGYRAAKAKGDEIGFDVLLGMELQPDGAYNEYLLYGLTEEFLYAHPHIYEEDLLTLRRLATENDILIFQAHPYRPGLTRAMPGFLDGVEVFNGNPRHNSGALTHKDDDSIEIDLSRIPRHVEKISLTATIYDADKRRQNFSMIRGATLKIFGAREEIATFPLENFTVETAIVLGEVYRYKGAWKFNATGAGFSGGLAALCNNFGIEVKDTQTPPPPPPDGYVMSLFCTLLASVIAATSKSAL